MNAQHERQFGLGYPFQLFHCFQFLQYIYFIGRKLNTDQAFTDRSFLSTHYLLYK